MDTVYIHGADKCAEGKLIKEMLLNIAKSKVPDRPSRMEPGAVKRRPKPYQLLTAPRHIFVEIQHIKKYKKQAQNNP